MVPCSVVPFLSSICTVSFDSFIKNLQQHSSRVVMLHECCVPSQNTRQLLLYRHMSNIAELHVSCRKMMLHRSRVLQDRT
jgi:hypothetical protein